MSLPLEDIIITIDTREKNNKRISAVETWGELHGAIVEHQVLKHLDYHILGDYKGHDVNIGIEAKALSQFCSDDYALNKEKLFAACSVYDAVGLFIETGNYEFVVSGFGETNISCTVKKDLTITGKLAIFEGACSTLGKYGIHVRQLRSEAHFPYAIENLITYSIHEHDIVHASDFLTQYKSTLLTFLTPLQMRKVVQAYPNMFWLCSAGEDAYQAIIGKKAGKKLYNFIRNPELVTPEWSNSHFPDGTEIRERVYDTQDVIKAVTEYLSGFPEGRTADEICTHFNLLSGDEDKEKLLECLKKMAYQGIITNTVTGLFHIPITKLQSHCDPAENEGTFLEKIHPHTTKPPISNPSPAVDNDKRIKICTSIDPETGLSKYDLDTCQQEQCIGCAECKDYKLKNDNDKTDKSVLITVPPPPPEPKTKGKAPVLSEFTEVIPKKLDISISKMKKDVIASSLKVNYCSKCGFQVNDQVIANTQKGKLIICDNCDENNPVFGTVIIPVSPHPEFKLSVRPQLEAYLQQPHTLQECIDKFDNFQKGTVWEHIMRMKREGVLIEFDNKTLVMSK